MVAFLETEREQAGWRFLLLWLFASNAGFLLGTIIEILLFSQPNLYFAVPLAALLQSWVINRHISIYLPWSVGTTIFWLIGALIAFQATNTMQNNDLMLTGNAFLDIGIELAIVGFIAGLFAGIPQVVFMRDWLPVGFWWLFVSAIAWAVLLPGLVTGIILMQIITKQKVPMTQRRYKLSGEF